MLESLARELHKFEQDDTTPVAIIHGLNGHFSSGYDMDELKEVAENSPSDIEKSLIVYIKNRPFTTSPTNFN